MKVKISQGTTIVLLSVIFLAVPALCQIAGRVNLTKSGPDTSFSGLDGIKQLPSTGSKSSPAVRPGQKSPIASSAESSESTETEDKSSDFSDTHDIKESNESNEEVNHGVKLRSNSSSSGSRFVPSTHFLFADHQLSDDTPETGLVAPSQRNTSSTFDLTHNEKHQLHQSTDDVFHDPIDLKAPVDTSYNPSDSVAVHSDSIPIRAGAAGSSSNAQRNPNGGGFVGIRKPIPILRQEAQPNDEQFSTSD